MEGYFGWSVGRWGLRYQPMTPLRGLTDVSELPVLPDQKVVLVGQLLQLLDQVHIKVRHNVDVRLRSPPPRPCQLPHEPKSWCVFLEARPGTDLDAAHVRAGSIGDPEQVGLGRNVDRDAQVGPLALNRGEQLAATGASDRSSAGRATGGPRWASRAGG